MTQQEQEDILDTFPNNWLDPLLSGPASVLGQPPFDCPAVERLINALRERVAAVMTTTA